MKKTLVTLALLLFALGVASLAQGTWATCPYDGARSQFTGQTRANPHAPPALQCQYSHQYYDKDHWATHTFWEPCGM